VLLARTFFKVGPSLNEIQENKNRHGPHHIQHGRKIKIRLSSLAVLSHTMSGRSSPDGASIMDSATIPDNYSNVEPKYAFLNELLQQREQVKSFVFCKIFCSATTAAYWLHCRAFCSRLFLTFSTQDLLAAADIGEMLLEKNRALNILMSEMQTKLEEKSETRRYSTRSDGDEPVAQRERVKAMKRARVFVSTRNKVM